MHNTKIKTGILLSLLCVLPTQADTTINVAASLLNFDYEEFDESGNSFNTEKGIIPGTFIYISSSGKSSRLTNSVGVELYGGQVNYDGQTQSGIPLTTDTNETIYRLFYKLDWSPENYGVSTYGKATWQQWGRDILSNRLTSGLFERYQWWAFELGFSLPLHKDNKNTWLFEFGITRTSNGTIQIDLDRQGFGRPKLDLGNGSGFTAALHYQFTMSAQSEIGFELRHQRWTFGRSNTKRISNGSILLDITEPRSISQHSSASITYRYYYF